MADIPSDELRAEVSEILKTADLSVMSTKKIREQVEKKLSCSLVSRKKEFDNIVLDLINQQQAEEDGSEGEEDDANNSVSEENNSEEDKKKAKKRPKPTPRKTPGKKKKSLNRDDSGSESDGGSDSDFEVPKKVAPKKKKGAAGGATGTGRKSTGFTRAYNLSPELSSLMGAESLPRHEVVKKVWALIKERNLFDPKNKQYAICDDELMKVMKVKRFRTFGMLKHLKPHFLD
ncbi:upstream activation factor subunit spp27-like [Teleopsis dalmanni]|uniref:upstream activation factor subunit spp27-like n=1 Tax=Teleopsis dalmanni TaxID=139649 RepID=UPI0018CD2125|nr:upstream activation factor subunit spp27-like [Teleopsis dalmanni]XP_037939088.1 upstream activation factor subunit spp27-like [Teleopsis dalmanni]